MANSVDPDQIAPQEQSDLDLHWFAYAILLETLVYECFGHLLSIYM